MMLPRHIIALETLAFHAVRWKRSDDGFVVSRCGFWRIAPVYGGGTRPESYKLYFDNRMAGSGQTQRECKAIAKSYAPRFYNKETR